MGTEICGCSSPFYKAAGTHAVSPLHPRIPDRASKTVFSHGWLNPQMRNPGTRRAVCFLKNIRK